MSTPAQIAANQANSKLSTGPISDAGRKIVSSNALKHGYCSKVHTLLPGEETAFAEYLQEYIKTYAPVSAPKRISSAPWRTTTGS